MSDDDVELDGAGVADADPTAEAVATTADERPPIELTEAALEALLFVAERPLSRREIAHAGRHGPGDRRRPPR